MSMGKSIETEGSLVAAKGSGGERLGSDCYRGDDKALTPLVVMAVQHYECN